jgi:hypothetical protein
MYRFPSHGADAVSGNTAFLQNTRLTGGQINQVYLSMGKSVDGRRGLDIGGTIDFTWGSDAFIVQAAGMENMTGMGGRPAEKARWGEGDYYSAFAQAYAEAEYGRLNVKAGKFLLPFGSSSYKSTDNFFYSWASTAYLTPLTGGGAYATYSLNNKWDVYGGWVMPESMGRYGSSQARNDAFFGGFSWTPNNRLNIRYTFVDGERTYKNTPRSTEREEAFVHTLLVAYKINRKLTNVFEWTLYNDNFWYINDWNNYTAYGINNELIYQASGSWAFGLRTSLVDRWGMCEWYTVALGANWTPSKWLTVKPELRYDWVESDSYIYDTPFNTFTNSYQFSGGMSAVVKF